MEKLSYVGIVAGLSALLWATPASASDNPRFALLSVAPEAGYQFFAESTLEKEWDTSVGPRHGIVVKAHLDVGGDRWALELAPLYAWQASDGPVGNLSVFGGEITSVYRFSSGSVYPNLGLGFHAAYIFPNDNVARGVELYARIPLGMTWYFLRFLGLVVEGGFMVGAVGIRFKDTDAAPQLYLLSDNTEYALTVGFDLLVGLRFP